MPGKNTIFRYNNRRHRKNSCCTPRVALPVVGATPLSVYFAAFLCPLSVEAAGRPLSTFFSKRIRMIFYFLRRSCIFPAFAALCSLAVSCSSGWSDDDERFVQTYTEILRIREQMPDTALANPKVREVIQNNGYTWESFRAAFTAYTAEAEKFRAMLDSARSRAQQPDTTGDER